MASRLDLADAQFIGFKHGIFNRHDIIGLVSAMGLTVKEWLKWKENYPNEPLTEDDIAEIDEYFHNEKYVKRKRELIKAGFVLQHLDNLGDVRVFKKGNKEIPVEEILCMTETKFKNIIKNLIIP